MIEREKREMGRGGKEDKDQPQILTTNSKLFTKTWADFGF